MYQAFYRKYRPRIFGDVAGQEHITETLRRQMVTGRLSHAYLFVGTRGTGKTTCAKILSRAVNCLDPSDGEPCNKCASCVGIEDGSILDVLELDAASNNSVDNVRALRDEAIYTPATVKKRVYIIDEVHMLSMSAFNALLKILEEPPEHILFILATTELHKVPATIQGRCQKFSFRRLSPDVLESRLKLIASKEALTLTDEAAEKLSFLADGSMRDGISLLDQCATGDVVDLAQVLETLGLAGNLEVYNLIDAVAKRETITALSLLDDLYSDGRDMGSLLGEMATHIRDLLIFKLSPDSGLLTSGSSRQILTAISGIISTERLFYCLDVLKTAITGMPRGGSSKLSVEMCIIRMCDESLSDSTEALLSRISRLESEPLSASVNAPTPTIELAEEIVAEVITEAEVVTDVVERVLTDVVSTFVEDVPEASIKDEKQGFWSEVLEQLKSDPPLYALLSDSTKVKARQEDNLLIITVADNFTANVIESEFSGPIKEAAAKVQDIDFIIRVEVGKVDTEEKEHSRLDSLSAFDIVSFE